MSEKNDFINITNDGGVKKKILIEGKGENQMKGNVVRIKYKRLDEKFLSEEVLQKNFVTTVFKLGNNTIIRGLDIGIQTMKVGEKSIFILSKEYTNISYRNINKKLKGSDKIKYLVELLESDMMDKKKNENNIKYNGSKSVGKVIRIKETKNIEKMRIKYEIKMSNELKLETYSPICDKCFRLIYISFDFIKNFISTKCSYCNKFDIFKYRTFIEKFKKINNPLLNACCQKCSKKLNFPDRIFYLIEKCDYEFSIFCDKCINEKEQQSYIKKFKIEELIRHNLYVYEKNNNLNKIK